MRPVMPWLTIAFCAISCANTKPPALTPSSYSGGDTPHTQAIDHTMIAIPAGSFISGSTPEEREQAYDDYQRTSGYNLAREHNWFAREEDRHVSKLPAFRIDQHPVTNAAYAEFVRDTGTQPPRIDKATWQKQGFTQDYETQVKRYNWTSDRPPDEREDHPVVLVTWEDAAAYCAWRGALMGEPRRLPSEAEYEKASRGAHGLTYPWGHSYEPNRLNSIVSGPGDTVAVGNYPEGASPYGVLDAAGNAFQWTSTSWPHKSEAMTVKGSAWDDYAGLGRGAARHGRRKWVRHIIVSFRCAAD